MEMSLSLVTTDPSARAGVWLDCPAPCHEGMKDVDRDESCDLSPCEELSRLDELDENALLTRLSALLILHKYPQQNAQTKGPSTLGVSVKR